jgi:hypothetical protein
MAAQGVIVSVIFLLRGLFVVDLSTTSGLQINTLSDVKYELIRFALIQIFLT